ncbi:hypothetical protein ACLKA6_009664 [Drosophila palustris]
MLRFWRQLVRNAVAVNATLIREWKNQRTRAQSWWRMQSHQRRAFTICTLVLTTGFLFQKWIKLNSLKSGDDKKTGADIKNQRKLNIEQKQMASHRETFKEVTIRGYENRLRAHAHPEKIFHYFATIKTKNQAGQWEVYMTPIDFLRSMMPGIRQPEALGLNKYRKMTTKQLKELKFKSVPADSIFYELRPDGLLTFTDYLFLRMLIPLPVKFFEIGFHLFDPQGSDSLPMKGLNQLLQGITNHERFKASNAISHYFFGPKLNGMLSLGKFLKFKEKLMYDVLLIEFNLLRKLDGPNRDTISELAFGNLLLAYSTMPTHQKVDTIRRIKMKYRKTAPGVTLDEFTAFFKFVQHIPTIDMALTYHFLAGADISRSTLKHISDIVVGVSLSPHIIDIIFTVFDTDNNDILGRTEFLQAVRQRMAKDKRTKMSDLIDIIFKNLSLNHIPNPISEPTSKPRRPFILRSADLMHSPDSFEDKRF